MLFTQVDGFNCLTPDFRDSKGHVGTHLAVTSRSVEMVELLLRRGGVISAEEDNGSTALHIAAANGDRKMIQRIGQFSLKSFGLCTTVSANKPACRISINALIQRNCFTA
jgi:Ankyrin repeats (3 copies)